MLQVRKLDDGDWCVDLGLKWYRVRADGSVITKQTMQLRNDPYRSIKTRAATKHEAAFARSKVASVITTANPGAKE